MKVSPFAVDSTGRFDVMLPLALLGVGLQLGLHCLDMEGWMWLDHFIASL